ncbi:probable E3 ubiquitin-protein ligase MID2 [Mercenaria mercenaria]|uniref:probable E3 ubiquitin-protein ligase MID2 n=1 Tax=Mercenaria mercenaria TaxID=6596 RepID=UPI00234EEE14|nr:probable E3 ubiquitin-protein ligase MID2 [Mercenaria mercenaria]XP_053385957.1 probable E3 ubiquitin-protein ligase MID2 [Mercenaria mercenaria]XP_053385958.1 probable E3 ubiquitin-protein ligase MID2 [Mercenaria mercenaria]XP_053385959.1 probable E3 ubiquitin-protein ligase MID2 [Mercenaria mercenaria]
MMDLSDTLKCPVCLGKFIRPKQLPCQHSLCNKPCLVEILKSSRNGHFSCPVCKTKHASPYGGADEVPRSLVLQQLLDVAEKNRETVSSSRQTKEYLASDEVKETENGHLSVNLSSEEAPDIDSSSVCNVCTEIDRPCNTCFHCGKKICKQCHEKHMDRVRNAILTYHDQIQVVKTRLEEKQIATNYILNENEEVASDLEIKRLFELFDQKRHYIATYFESVQSIIEGNADENNLIAIMFQGEEHLTALSELEINPAMYKLQTQLERQSTPAANYESRQPSNNSSKKQVNHNVSTNSVPANHLAVDRLNPELQNIPAASFEDQQPTIYRSNIAPVLHPGVAFPSRRNERSGQQSNDLTTHAGNEGQTQHRAIIFLNRNDNRRKVLFSGIVFALCALLLLILMIRFQS